MAANPKDQNTSAERLKALQLTVDKLEKVYGKGTIMKLGDERVIAVDTVSSGSLGLDIALGIGGLPKGRIGEDEVCPTQPGTLVG